MNLSNFLNLVSFVRLQNSTGGMMNYRPHNNTTEISKFQVDKKLGNDKKE